VDYYFIGEPEIATAFRFTGVDGTGVTNPDETREAFRAVTAGEKGPCRILILTEDASVDIGGALTDWQMSGRYPLVVELPGLKGHPKGRKSLVDSIREAIGISV
jgi:V/A-type H+-transporting ATPase subunit F